MEWRWSWLWSILWNVLVHAVTLNWNALSGDAESFKSWWRSFWGEVENRVNGVRSWAQGQISWLSGYAFGLYVQTVNWARDQINGVRSWAQGQISWLSGYAYGLYIQALNWINSQIASIRNLASNLAQQVKDALYPYIDYWIRWVQARFEWIQPWRDLITGWLARAKGAIDWLWQFAWGSLQAFLSDPVGFVLGWLLTPIRNIVNFWQQYGPMLQTFVANELAEWYTTWHNGKRVLKALVDDPEGFILDLIAPKFVDWLIQLIADNW